MQGEVVGAVVIEVLCDDIAEEDLQGQVVAADTDDVLCDVDAVVGDGLQGEEAQVVDKDVGALCGVDAVAEELVPGEETQVVGEAVLCDVGVADEQGD